MSICISFLNCPTPVDPNANTNKDPIITYDSVYVIDHEVLTNNKSGNKILSNYTYDDHGNIIQKRAYDGIDTSILAMSTIKYVFDSTFNLIAEILLSDLDTLSRVYYTYSGENVTAIKAYNQAGVLKFMDSLIYDIAGNCVEEQRITLAGKVFYHSYIYNASNQKITDTLFEANGAVYVSKQSVAYTYNIDSTVSLKQKYIKNSGQWLLKEKVVMSYNTGKLISATAYEGGGIGTTLIDSLVFAYDIFGNRIKEDKYDSEKQLAHSIDYTWEKILSIIESIRYYFKSTFYAKKII